jgi:hypothetical protein
MLRGKPIRLALQEIVPDVRLLSLDDSFAAQDPGEAAEKLLNDVNNALVLASPQA